MQEYYHYTLENKVNEILRSGIFANHPYFTTNSYYIAYEAGNAIGVMSHNIECVLLFRDDGLFKNCGVVPDSKNGLLQGGAIQYQHPSRPKPIAKRKITERNWIYF